VRGIVANAFFAQTKPASAAQITTANLANDQCFETLPVVPQQQAHTRLVYLLHQNLKQSLEHDYQHIYSSSI
jgi:hypothetical protein